MKKSIDNFILEGWIPTPLEQSLMDDTLEQLLLKSTDDSFEDIPSDFLEVQDFDDAMEEIKAEIEKWM